MPPDGIIPAYAGSTQLALMKPGDLVGSSPHTRGARAPSCGAASKRWIIPAYAGSTRRLPVRRTRSRDHPRIRGEHFRDAPAEDVDAGSSPHTRGAPTFSAMLSPPLGIIPAYAGSTRWTPAVEARWWDHPRIRGEHSAKTNGGGSRGGSSPHTRGAPVHAGERFGESRIIPAYAGSTAGCSRA